MKRLTCRLLTSVALLVALAPDQLHAGGVTVITHGLDGHTDGWVRGMADAITRFSPLTTNSTVFRFGFQQVGTELFLSSTQLSGGDPRRTLGGEIVVLFDWRQLADGYSYTTYQVAALLVPALLSTNFVAELGGHALAEFPIHLVGHSRGGSLVCEASRLLGTTGVWVDHVTTLDAHPLNNDGFELLDSLLYSAVDAPADICESVLFADSYYQNSHLFVYGEPASGAFWRWQTDLTGGYTSPKSGSHSDIHLWYHATIDLNTPVTDTEGWITASERSAWWTASENRGANAGFSYSLIGRGDRFSAVQPNGFASSRVRDGVNQLWDFGAGLTNNRTRLSSNSGEWPNPIRFDLLSTNVVAIGEESTLYLYYQWAAPTSRVQTLSVYLDDDLNPLSGNELLLKTGPVASTAGSQLGQGSIRVQWNSANTRPGLHALLVTLASADRTRTLYAPQLVRILAPPPLSIDVSTGTAGSVVVGVSGRVGQTLVLQQSPDLNRWQAIATNTLEGTRWETAQPFDGEGTQRMFFRAFAQ